MGLRKLKTLRCLQEKDSNPVSWAARFVAGRTVERGCRGIDGAVG